MTASLTSFPCKYVSFLLSCLSSPSTFFRSLSPFELPVFVPLGAFVDRFAEHHDCVKWHCVFGFPWPSTARRSSVLALTLTLTPLVAGMLGHILLPSPGWCLFANVVSLHSLLVLPAGSWGGLVT